MYRFVGMIGAGVLLGTAAAAQGFESGGYHPHMFDGGFGMGYGLIGGGMMLVIAIGVVLGTVALLRWLGPTGAADSNGGAALGILRERLARGEIDAEEFTQRKKALQM
ncbi:SHOCT domain-containing protein [Puniceibacterium confluentis]|uniref:SHOCT domain-containing protein n=1 Tax=Puniceibacterium confluentis TaxID=1958944 RepID=UPI001C9574A1|nr:SHOCT domain-containing protein [Puniceibacterium confluentis]